MEKIWKKFGYRKSLSTWPTETRDCALLVRLMIRKGLRHRFLLNGIFVSLVMTSPAHTLEFGERYWFSIHEDDLGSALKSMVEVTGDQLILSHDLAKKKSINPVIGYYTVEEALGVLLSEAGVSGTLTDGGVIVVSPIKTELSELPETSVNNKFKNSILAALAAALVGTQSTHAQTSRVQSIDEIVITARKRQESILKVPVVATVLGQEAINQFQINDLYSVAERVPGFVMAESVGTVGIQAALRGIGPTSTTPSVDQSVSLNIDGLALTQGHAFTAGMFDVAQVEVLKGPQALFYGKNSTAGVIALRSNDPTDDVEITLATGYETEASEEVLEFVVSGPVSDSLKLRLAARSSDMNGYFENTGKPIPGLGNLVPRHKDFSPRENTIIRATALIEPGNFYTARFKANYVEERWDGSGGDGQIIYCTDGTAGVPPVNIPFIGDSDCSLDEKTQLGDFDPLFWPGIRNAGVPFMDSSQVFGTIEQSAEITPELEFTSVTGIYEIERDNLIRGSGSSNPTIAADFTFENYQLTQELRLTSDYIDQPINFMVGGFYQGGEMKVRNRLRANTALGLPPLLQSGLHDVDIEALSLFGQLLWQVTDEIELSGGARWTDEERDHEFTNILGGGNQVDLLVPSIRATNLSPEASITYTPRDNLTLFASYREGFKSGSFNTTVSANSSTRADFGDEKAKGGELGIKTRLLNDMMTLNLAGYYYKYSDLQVGSNVKTASGAVLARTINAASADVKGLEFDFAYNLPGVVGLNLYGAANYNLSKYDDFGNAPCGGGQTISEGCNQLLDTSTQRFTSQDLSGEDLVKAPRWVANFGVDYEFDISSQLSMSLGLNASYSDEYFTNLTALPEYKQDSFIKTNASVRLSDINDAWDISIIGKNLGNEITVGMCSNSNIQNGSILGGQISGTYSKGPAGSDELTCIAERGREIWLRLTVRPAILFDQ